MEFEGEHEEEQEEEDGDTQPPQIIFHPQPQPAAINGGVAVARYRECLKNHALSSGGHSVDGCGEFMPCADDPFKCAACTCHRSFHRKEHQPYFTPTITSPPPAAIYPPQFYHHRPPPPPPGFFPHHPLALPAAENNDHLNPSGSGKKRIRTKFTAEQKGKMLEFADSVGWKIQKHDEEVVERLCSELQISRQVLKVWLHNNKNLAGGRSRMP